MKTKWRPNVASAATFAVTTAFLATACSESHRDVSARSAPSESTAPRPLASTVPSSASPAGSSSPDSDAELVDHASPEATVEEAAPPPPAPDPLETPTLLDEQGKPLGQTEERPSTDSAPFQRRLALLWEAIVKDDPEIAMPAFFPKVAYEQVKAIADPGRDWNNRLVKAFHRNVHDYHQQLGADAQKAELLGIEINEDKVKWMKPHSEGNTLGYFRITRGKLRYRTGPAPDAKERTLEITSMISWRGEWFIVHLNGFK